MGLLSLPTTIGNRHQKRMGWLLILLIALLCFALATNLRFLHGAQGRQHLNNGLSLFHANQIRAATLEWRAAIAADPADPTAYQLLANAYMEGRAPDLALPLLEQLLKIAPNTPHTRCRLAEAYTLLGQNGRALPVARDAVTAEPECPRANAILGIQRGNSGDTRGSVESLAKAHLLALDDDPIALSYAQAQLDAIDLPGAEATVRQVLARTPNSAMAYYLLGWNYAHRAPTSANQETAISALQKAIALDPSRLDAQLQVGQLLVQAKRYSEAQTVLERLWQQDKTNAQVAYNLAQVYRAVKKPQEAQAMLRAFAGLQSDEEQYQALLKRAALDPENPQIAVQLAEKDIARGQTQEAAVLLRNVLQKYPDDSQARALTARLLPKNVVAR